MTHAPTDLVGQNLGPLHLEKLLGQGGFAWVFVGREADGTPVAVKVLKPRYAGDRQFEQRFRHESETASRLDHPNIVRIRAIAREGEQVYFTMDLCADSLGARLTREGPLPESDTLRLARDVVKALGFAHERGVIHRDLKPDNVLIRSDGSAVITDFGIAKAISGYVASTGVDVTIGTPHYLSPEQAQGRPVDHRADFYSLGITLYKAATGDVPFSATDWFELARMHVEDPPPSLRKKRPELTRRFERVVMKCLAKHPDDRYQTAAEFLADLDDVEAKQRPTLDLGRAPAGSTNHLPAPHPLRRWRWLVPLGIIAVVAGLVALALRTLR